MVVYGFPRVDADQTLLLAAAVTCLVFLLVGELTSLYHGWRGVPLYREVVSASLNWLYSLGILLAVGFLTRYTDELSRIALLSGAASVIVLLILSRVTVRSLQRWYRTHGYGTRRFAIAGVNDLGIRLARNLEDSPELGLELLGFFDDRAVQRTEKLPSDVGDKLGNLQQLVAAANKGEVDRVYITLLPMLAEKRTRELLNQLADTSVSVYIVPDFFRLRAASFSLDRHQRLAGWSVFENPFYGVDGCSNGFATLRLACTFLAIAFVPMVVISLLVKLTSPGPVFFRQQRYGLDGREIRVWKFRSMRVCEVGAAARQAIKDDPRVTPVGRILRKTSLDELPQLFNVLEGSMSLVGPRPHATAQNEHYRRLIPGYMLRHKVKPGITGLAQVLGWRGETDSLDKMANRIQCDLQYIREWSLWMDLKILFKTIFVVLSRENAY